MEDKKYYKKLGNMILQSVKNPAINADYHKFINEIKLLYKFIMVRYPNLEDCEDAFRLFDAQLESICDRCVIAFKDNKNNFLFCDHDSGILNQKFYERKINEIYETSKCFVRNTYLEYRKKLIDFYKEKLIEKENEYIRNMYEIERMGYFL